MLPASAPLIWAAKDIKDDRFGMAFVLTQKTVAEYPKLDDRRNALLLTGIVVKRGPRSRFTVFSKAFSEEADDSDGPDDIVKAASPFMGC